MKKKYNWKLLNKHSRNYGGSCRFCGGVCENEDVIKQWDELNEELFYLSNYRFLNEKALARYRYLSSRRDKCLTYIINY